MQRAASPAPAAEAAPAGAAPTAPVHAQPSLAGALLRSARPRQWLKNVLVMAVPAAAGELHVAGVAGRTALAFVAFCLVASGGYLLNDVRDRAHDRLHPAKHRRPIASGELAVRPALGAAGGLLVAGLALGSLLGWKFELAILAYLAIQAGYTLALRRVEVVDLAAVASLYVVRVVAGGLATGITASRWLLIVVSFGALFVVAGKRFGDLADVPDEPGTVRPTLGVYTPDYLRFVWSLAGAVTILAYCLWAFTVGPKYGALAELSVLPFTLTVLRYGLRLEAGHGGAPEDVVLSDRTLQVLALSWAVVYGVGIYLGH